MAFGPGGGSPDEIKGDINVTPLVDVCLVLLIIFMVVTPMLQSGVDVLLPEGPHAVKKPGKEGDLVISIKQDGTVFVGQDWIPDRDLPRYLKAEHDKDPSRNVMLKADKRINFGRVRLVMKAANDANFSGVSILTQNQLMSTIEADGMYLNTQKVASTTELANLIGAQMRGRATSDKVVFINAEDTQAFDRAVVAMDAAHEGGAVKIGFLTEPPAK